MESYRTESESVHSRTPEFQIWTHEKSICGARKESCPALECGFESFLKS
jgi:hypothetical protein